MARRADWHGPIRRSAVSFFSSSHWLWFGNLHISFGRRADCRPENPKKSYPTKVNTSHTNLTLHVATYYRFTQSCRSLSLRCSDLSVSPTIIFSIDSSHYGFIAHDFHTLKAVAFQSSLTRLKAIQFFSFAQSKVKTKVLMIILGSSSYFASSFSWVCCWIWKIDQFKVQSDQPRL